MQENTQRQQLSVKLENETLNNKKLLRDSLQKDPVIEPHEKSVTVQCNAQPICAVSFQISND